MTVLAKKKPSHYLVILQASNTVHINTAVCAHNFICLRGHGLTGTTANMYLQTQDVGIFSPDKTKI